MPTADGFVQAAVLLALATVPLSTSVPCAPPISLDPTARKGDPKYKESSVQPSATLRANRAFPLQPALSQFAQANEYRAQADTALAL